MSALDARLVLLSWLQVFWTCVAEAWCVCTGAPRGRSYCRCSSVSNG